MSDFSESARLLSLVQLNFLNAVESAQKSCRDEVFVDMKRRFIDPQVKANERFLDICPELIESLEQINKLLCD